MGKSFSEALKEAQKQEKPETETEAIATEEHVHTISALLYIQSGRFVCGHCGQAIYLPEQDKWIETDDSAQNETK
jgi:hypothetical protein